MFLYRVKVGDLDNTCLATLRDDLARQEKCLQVDYPIREMSVVTEGDADHRALDICLALDDIVGGEQLRQLVAKLHTFLDFDFKPGKPKARVSSELIHI